MSTRKTPLLSSPTRDKIRDFIDDEKSLGRTTKGQVAAAIGIRPSHFSNLLNGRNEWKLSQLEKLAEFLEVPLTRLFAERGRASLERSARADREQARGNHEEETEDRILQALKAEADGLRTTLRNDMELLLRERLPRSDGSRANPYTTDRVPSDYVTDGGRRNDVLPVEMRELDATYDAPAVTRTAESVWFGRAWLRRQGLDSTRCLIVLMQDDSMAATLPHGCSVLVNRRQRQRREGHIFAIRSDDRLLIRRTRKDASGAWRLECDHPDWPAVAWPDDAEIVGKVRWMAQTF